MLKHYPNIEPLEEYEECTENHFQFVIDDYEERPLWRWGDVLNQLQCLFVFEELISKRAEIHFWSKLSY